MPPFLQFRLWMREGPRGERVAAAVTAVVVLAVAIAALVPVTRDAGAVVGLGMPAAGTSPGVAPAAGSAAPASGPAGPTGPGGTATGPGGAVSGPGGAGAASPGAAPGRAGGAPGAPGGSTAPGPASTGNCGRLTSSASGVTPTEIHLDMANVSLAGPVGNSTFNVRPDLGKIAQALADDVNQHGGVSCGRKIVLKQYDVNPLDSNDSQSKCLQMASDHPFLVVNFGAYLTPAARQCFVQNKLLEESATQVDEHELQTSYPYLFAAEAVAEQDVDAAVTGLAKRGYFSGTKFRKLGLFEDACDPPVNQRIDEDLAKVGVPSSKVSKYTLDCNVASPPDQIEQGVLQHKAANVSHVLLLSSETNDQNYVRIANGQRFSPQYFVTDYGSNTSGSGTTNWGSAFDGAVAITTSRVGELSSGIHNPQEVRCDKILRAHGVNGIQSENKDTSAMQYCNLFWIVVQALENSGANPTQTGFLQGLSTMGLFRTVQVGDGNFNRAGKLTGGDYVRSLVYRGGCGCWKIGERNMRPIG